MIRKLDDRTADPTRLTVYSYDEKSRICQKNWYDTTVVRNTYKSSFTNYYYNKNGFNDSSMSINFWPVFDFLPINEKSFKENIVEYSEPIWRAPDSCDTGGLFSLDGKICVGYLKIKKEAVLKMMQVDTTSGFGYKYYFNSQNKLIKEVPKLFDSNYYGASTFFYDDKGRVSEKHFNYEVNAPRQKLDPKEDSIYKWEQYHYTVYFNYEDNNTLIETAVFSNRIHRLVCSRNIKGQVLIHTRVI